MAKNRLKSQLANTTKKNALLHKIAALFAANPRSLVIKKGDFRANAADLDAVALDETLDYNNLEFQRPPLADGKEQTTVVVSAEAGVKEVTTVTAVADSSGSLNNTYFTFKAKNSGGASETGYYVWFNVNSAGVDPAVASHTGIEVALATDDTASTVGGAMRSAITATAGSKVVVTGSTTQAIITGKYMGNATNAADGAAATGFTIATTTAGVASSLLNKYFKLYTAEDATGYYVWFNVNSEGTDPAVASHTAVPITVSIGDSASTIATAVASALDALAGFVSSASTSTVTITNADAGYASDTVDGAAATGFTITKLGELEQYDTADIIMIRRLRTKKWMIELSESASAAHGS